MLESSVIEMPRKAWAYSLCGSSTSTRRFGLTLTASRSSSDTALDLPTPVVPTTAKWQRSMSLTETVAGMVASCESQPTSMALRPPRS